MNILHISLTIKRNQQMKKLVTLFSLLTLFTFVGCGGSSSEEPFIPELNISKDNITIAADGGSATVTVYCNDQWTLSNTCDWCRPSVTSGEANTAGQTVTFSAEESYDKRSATFTFKCGDIRKQLVVSQDKKSVLFIHENDVEKIVSGFDQEISITYDSSVGCQFVIPEEAKDWISTSAPTKALSTYYKKLYVSANRTGVERRAVVKLQSMEDKDLFDEITVIQSPGYCIEYTTTNGNELTFAEHLFDSKILKHSYTEDGGVVYFESPITAIHSKAFYECETLASINISEGVTEIGSEAFWRCSNLTTVSLPKSLTTIKEYAFGVCSNLTSIILPENITTIEKSTFSGCTNLTSIILPENITTIEVATFSSCTNLSNITLPEKLTTIGHEAFRNCSNLATINIPKNISSIGWYAFYECTNLKDVYISDLHKWCEITFEDRYANPLRYGANLWCNDELVTNLPDGITQLGQFQFIGCGSFKKITTPKSLTKIGLAAFSFCENLEEIECSEGLTTIEESTFSGCNNMTTVYLPKSTTTIGKGAFNTCEKLKTVYLKATTPPAIHYYRATLSTGTVTYTAVFKSNDNLTIYVPRESYDDYIALTGNGYNSGNCDPINWSAYKWHLQPYDFE